MTQNWLTEPFLRLVEADSLLLDECDKRFQLIYPKIRLVIGTSGHLNDSLAGCIAFLYEHRIFNSQPHHIHLVLGAIQLNIDCDNI